jgi:hypothetical protein
MDLKEYQLALGMGNSGYCYNLFHRKEGARKWEKDLSNQPIGQP